LLTFSNEQIKGSKNYKEYLRIEYKDVYGYSNVLYGMEKLKWHGDQSKKPSESRCFKIEAYILGVKSPVYFCVFNQRADWSNQERDLSTSEALYVNELWVSMINYKLHEYNLGIAREKMLRTVKKVDCNAHIMEPIKYEYRIRVKSYTYNI